MNLKVAMDWRVRTARCAVVALLVVSALVPAEAFRGGRIGVPIGGGGRGGGGRGGGGRGGGGRGGWGRGGGNRPTVPPPRDRNYQNSYNHRPGTQGYDFQSYGPAHHMTPIPDAVYMTAREFKELMSRGHQPTEAPRKASREKYYLHRLSIETPRKVVTEKNERYEEPTELYANGEVVVDGRHYTMYKIREVDESVPHKPTEATPASTTHRHRHGHGSPSMHYVSGPEERLNSVQPTQQPNFQQPLQQPSHTTADSSDRSRDVFQMDGLPDGIRPPRLPYRPPPPGLPIRAVGWNDETNTNKHPPGPDLNVAGSNLKQGLHGQPPSPNSYVLDGSAKKQPSASDLSPSHKNVESGAGSKTVDYPKQPYNPNYHETQQAPSPYNPNFRGTQQALPSYSSNYHSTRQAPPPYTPPGHTPPAYNPNEPPPAYSSSGYRSSLFGYSKRAFRPSLPKIIFLPIPHYHYPSNIPPRWTWGCDCYVQDKTAVCTHKLSDGHIPSCVSSSVSAVFIQTRAVDQLSVNAFSYIPHLEYINITDTKLRSLPSDLFRDTQDLKHLLVQNNPELRTLDSDLFRGASKLEDVILDSNDISTLDQDVFTHLTNVKRLNLAYNKIKSLPEGIFRANRELEELGLSGNPLFILSYKAKDLLRNNAKLRVLLMRNCQLEDFPTDLLRNATNLEWLDLSSNEISKFPSEFIQDCSKLGYLGLANNKLKVLGSDMFLQLSRSLATLELEGNPWHCDCKLLPLASWAALRKDAVMGQPKCSSPHDLKNEPLERWIHSKDAMKCGGATSALRTDLNRLMSVARAIAKRGPTFFANLLAVSDKEVSFTATNYFLYAMAAQTDANVESVVWHWTRFLEKVLDRRHLRHAEEVAKYGTDMINMDRKLLIFRTTEEDPTGVNIDYNMDPLTTTTTKPPGARDIENPPRPKGFELLMNFTYVLEDVPENLTKAVDDGIEEELKILFGVISGTNATNLNATASNITAMNSTANATTDSANTTVTPAPVSQNTTSKTTDSQDPAIMFASFPPSPLTLSPNPPSAASLSASKALLANTSSVIPVNATLKATSLANSTSPTNQTVTNSNSSLTGLNATTVSAYGTAVPLKKPIATEQTVAGLRSELREVLSTLLLSIDRAKRDASYQKSLKEADEKAEESLVVLIPAKYTRGGAESCMLVLPRITVLVTVLTVLVHNLL